MGSVYHGESQEKPKLKLDGKKVLVKRIGVCHYDKKSETSFSYIEEVTYHFKTEEEASEYYYKMR